MSFQHFRVLMWKNLLLKIHHWFTTFFEFFLPIATTLLILVIYKLANTTYERIQRTDSQSPVETGLHYPVATRPYIVYTPSNPVIDEFLKPLKSRPEVRGVTAFKNNVQMENYLFQNKSRQHVGVLFQNVESAESMPDKLSYVLRQSVEDPSMSNVFVRYDYTEAFIGTQWLLNELFVQHVPKTNVTPWNGTLRIESFPPRPSSGHARIGLFLVFIVISFTICVLSIAVMSDIIEEKNSGVKEMMKISGVKEWMIWLCWFLFALFSITISLTIVVLLMMVISINSAGDKLFDVTPPIVLWSFLILYCAANISLCFTLTGIFQSSNILSLLYFLYFVIMIYRGGFRFIDSYVPYLVWFLPLGPFNFGYEELCYYENEQISMTWITFGNTQNKTFRNVPYGLTLVFILLGVNIVLYLFLAFYITSINPGKFGTRKSPFFMFQALFSLFLKKKIESAPPLSSDFKTNPKYFETPPSHLQTTIVISNLHKRFKGLHAVRGVNLTTFDGEITALLGHNGAGKTTTLSILTGLLSPTSGSIHYRSTDVFKNLDEFRLLIGLCPQENRMFPHLTVVNHLLFYGQLKGLKLEDAVGEANQYLHITGLEPQRHSKVDSLSGGMKRKLSLCIAMMGKAEVLILDEPSSGMDAESRRSLWNLLLKLRKNRTMILTTHYMEEADILGDRIAIMNHGIIVCYGTSMFLKKAYETGYELTVTKSTDNSNAITSLVQSNLPTASVSSDTTQNIVYKLPLTETNKFSTMFQALEASKQRLGIQEIGVAATTMEDVFLKAGGATAYDPKSPKIDARAGAHRRPLGGILLFIQQLWAVFKKKALFTTRDLWSIFMRIIFVTVVLYFLFRTPRKLPGDRDDLTFRAHSKQKVLYQEVDPAISLEDLFNEYVSEYGGKLEKGSGNNIEDTLWEIVNENPEHYQEEYLSAVSLENRSVRLLHSQDAYSKPVTIDMFYNVLLRYLTGGKQYSVEIFSLPVPMKETDNDVSIATQCARGNDLDENTYILKWFFLIGFFTSDILLYFSPFVSSERVDGFYHIQMMSRLNPFIYWFGTLLFDLLLFSIFMIFRLGLFTINNSADLIGLHDAFYILALAILLYGLSTLLMIYVLSFLIDTKNGAFKIFFPLNGLLAVFVVIYFMVVQLFHWLALHNTIIDPGTWANFGIALLRLLSFIFPSGTFFLLFLNWGRIFTWNSRCSNCNEYYREECEALTEKVSYWEYSSDYNPFGIAPQMVTLVVQIFVFAMILILLFSGLLDLLSNSMKVALFGFYSTRLDRGDDDVRKENEDVIKYRHFDSKKKQDVSLLVNGLRKNFIEWCQNFTAVSNVSFLVDRGTCFGLLGVNGAGKTTTFKMLTAEILPTRGDASIDGNKLSVNKSKYLSLAGYCPQTNCFIEQLTGTEMLIMIALMRGVRSSDIDPLVNRWISIIGLGEYKDRKCGSYSGGNKRKLCSAMSLIGDPDVVFLDEPTSGVDPVSRRSLYDVMAHTKRLGQTVVLTSHSMEECEILCDRLTIMVSGVMKCIGTVQHLKKRYAQGFSLMIKVKDSDEAKKELPSFKPFVEATFAPVRIILKDERAGVLFYQITDTTLLWSVLFQRVESIKSKYPNVVDDYVLADTTLEEVFISFAKEKF